MKPISKTEEQHITELELESQLSNYFQGFGGTDKVQRQVYYGGKRIDIVIMHAASTTSFEVKLSDWKGALKQAQLNKTACEYSYVALWSRKANAAIENLHEFTNRKIGLILIDSGKDPICIFSPSKDSCFSSIASAQLRLGSV